MTNMMNAAVLIEDGCVNPKEFDKDKVETYLEEKGVLDTSEFGVSLCVLLVMRRRD